MHVSIKYIYIYKMGMIIVSSIEILRGSNENKASDVLSMVLGTERVLKNYCLLLLFRHRHDMEIYFTVVQ